MMKTKFVFAVVLSLMCTLSLTAQDKTTTSGIKYSILEPGDGEKPTRGQEVYFHIEVTSVDGNELFSTVDMNVPVHVVIGKDEDDSAIKAVQEVLVDMQEGSKSRMEVPKEAIPDDMANNLEDDIVIYVVDLIAVSDAKPSGTEKVVDAANTGGVDAAQKTFESLKRDGSYVFAEWDMNRAGYDMLKNSKTDAAVALFKMNTQLNPGSWNAYDSLGDAYAAKGDKANAKASYEKALALNPDYAASRDKLDKL